MVNFKAFIKKERFSITQLANDFGYSRGHLTTIANGGPAGKLLARIIEDWSCGQVSANSVLYPEQYQAGGRTHYE